MALGHHSSQGDGSSLGMEMTYLGALSDPAVPLGSWCGHNCVCHSQTFLQWSKAGNQEALWWWGIPAVVKGRSQRYPAVLQRQLAHSGYKIKAAACFWQLLLKAYTCVQYCIVPHTSSSRVYNQKNQIIWIFSSRSISLLVPPSLAMKDHLDNKFNLEVKNKNTNQPIKQKNPQKTKTKQMHPTKEKTNSPPLLQDIANWLYTLKSQLSSWWEISYCDAISKSSTFSLHGRDTDLLVNVLRLT